MSEGRRRFDVIGAPRRRVDGRAKVTGKTLFADDLELPRMLHCRLLRSPLPHARIRSLDPSRALSMPGVHRVAALLKRWLLGTHQGAIRPEQLDHYLDEFTFRFNRRKFLHVGKIFHRFVEQLVLQSINHWGS